MLIDAEAKCACGSVVLTVVGELQNFIVCHCDYCQRVTGASGTFSAQFLEEDIKSIVGETTIYEVPSWPGAEMHFCSTCGTNVHWKNPYFPGMHT